MLILDLWGISFHAVVVFGLGKNILFKSVLGRCDQEGNLKVRLLIKTSNYIVPNPSTTLDLCWLNISCFV